MKKEPETDAERLRALQLHGLFSAVAAVCTIINVMILAVWLIRHGGK
jgi:hypothetical protein